MGQWRGDTYENRLTDMKTQFYDPNLEKHGHKAITLSEYEGKYFARFVVAHISPPGWVDLFIGVCDDNPESDSLRHVALTPSEYAALLAGYTPEPE